MFFLKKRLYRSAKTSLKRVALLIAVSLLLQSIPSLAAWDGFTESDDEVDKEFTVVDMNKPGMIIQSGAEPSQARTKNATYAAHWKEHHKTRALNFSPTITDWTDYHQIEFWIYSEKAVNSQFMVIVRTDGGSAGRYAYYQSTINIDWTGWKQFVYRFDDIVNFAPSRNPNLGAVENIAFTTQGWSLVANEESDLYIDSVILRRTKPLGITGRLYPQEAVKIAEEAMEDGLFVYNASANIIVNGENYCMQSQGGNPYPAAKQLNDELMISLEALNQYVGAQITGDDKSRTIVVENTKLEIRVGSSNGKKNGKAVTLSAAPVLENGVFYVPLDVAELLSKDVLIYKDFAAVGSKENLIPLNENRQVLEAASFLTAYEPLDESAVTEEDYQIIKDRWRENLVGNEKNNSDIPEIAKKVTDITEEGRRHWQSMRKGSGIKSLWSVNPITTTAGMTSDFQKIAAMAKAYAIPGGQLYHNTQLKNDIIYALDWMNENIYGENELNGRGWRDLDAFNWWDWSIGSPGPLINTLILMEEELSQASINRYLKLFDYLVPTASGTGANGVDTARLVIGASLLKREPQRLVTARDALNTELVYVTEGVGMYEDGTYLFHGYHPLNGSYGEGHFTGIASLITLLSDTPFKMTLPEKKNLYEWIFKAYAPFMHRGGVMSMMRGREISRTTDEHARGGNMIEGMLGYISALSDKDEINSVKAMVKHHVLSNKVVDIYNRISLKNIPLLKEILESPCIDPTDFYNGYNKNLHHGDRMVHHTKDFAAGLAMSSSRVYNYESINNENLMGWYTGDGMLYLYDDDVKQFDYAFWSNVNPYRMPGTTVNTRERRPISVAGRAEFLSSKDFVGGATLNDTYGTAAMWVDSYGLLEAQKSWFFFDDEIVALGAGIQSFDGTNAETIIENRKSSNTVMVEAQGTLPYEILGVEASDVPQAANTPENTLDKDMGTRWSAEGEAWIAYDLGEVKTVDYAAIGFYQGNQRKSFFDLEVSQDGENWEMVYSGESSGETNEYEIFDLKNSKARFVRYSGHGNSGNAWNSVSEFAVYPTPVDGQRAVGRAVFAGAEAVTVDGSVRNVGEDVTEIPNASWAHLENTAGYYFPQKGNIKMRKTSEKSPSFFEMWVDHGVSKSADYAYVLLPGKTAAQTDAYSKNPDITVIRNTKGIQAVKENKLGITSAVFWEAGSINEITVTKPLIVMVQQSQGGATLAVSDPTHKLDEAFVTLNLPIELAEGDPEVEVNAQTDTSVTVKLNLSNSNGKTIQATFNNR